MSQSPKFLLLVINFLLSVSLYSADFTAKDLLKIWDDESLTDSARFESASLYSMRFYRDRSEDSLLFDLYNDFIRKARELKSPYWYSTARACEIDIRTGITSSDPVEEYESLLNELKPLNDALIMVPVYERIRWYFYQMNNQARKLEYELRQLKLMEKEHSTHPEYIMLLHRIGEGYEHIRDYGRARMYYTEAADIAFSVEDWNQVGGSHYNLAVLAKTQGDTANQKLHLRKALKFALKTDNEAFISMLRVLNSVTYAYEDNFDLARNYLNQGLSWFEDHGSTTWIIESHWMLAEIEYEAGNLNLAISNLEIALEIAKERQLTSMIYETKRLLHQYYSKKGDYSKAYSSLSDYNHFKDSLDATQNAGESAALLNQYQNDKRRLKDSLERAKVEEIKDMEHQSELQQQRNTQYVLGAGVGFMVILAIVLFRGFNRKKKDNEIISEQKIEVERQKDEIESQHQEIRDSIDYAKRIQSAILPPKKLVDKCLPDSFILYKPKDVVAGDFYWLEERDGKVLFAAADCTGHGVPGAMVSVICNNGLNRSVREHGLTSPSKILDRTREIVIKEFEKSEEEVKDGMDISLCQLDGARLLFSGAHNSAWIIRKDSNEVEVLPADKQPIGQFSHAEAFTQRETILNDGDTLYLTTDGFADQFGGEKGKKFKTVNFKKLLLSLQDKTMSQQKGEINEAFEKWAGSHEQVDDVCVIGFRYKA